MKTKSKRTRSGRVRLRLKSKFDTEYVNCGERQFKALPVKGDVLEIRKDGELRFFQVLGFLDTESTRGRRGTLFAVERDQREADQMLLDAERRNPPVRVWLRLVDRQTGARRYLGTEPHEFVVAPRSGEYISHVFENRDRCMEVLAVEHRPGADTLRALVIERAVSIVSMSGPSTPPPDCEN